MASQAQQVSNRIATAAKAKQSVQSNLGGWLSAGAGFLGSVFQALYSGRQNKIEREWREAMWNKQNEYDLPKNQVQRLLDAGLNPDLMYGQSASAQGTAMPSGNDVVSSVSNPATAAAATLMQMQEYKMRNAQIQTQEALTDKYKSEADRNRRWMTSQDIVDDYTLSKIGLTAAQVSVANKTIDQITAMIDNLNANTDWVKDKDMEQQINNIFVWERNEQEINELVSRVAKNKADAALARELAKKTIQEVQNLQKEFELLEKEGELTDWKKNQLKIQFVRDYYDYCREVGRGKVVYGYDPETKKYGLGGKILMIGTEIFSGIGQLFSGSAVLSHYGAQSTITSTEQSYDPKNNTVHTQTVKGARRRFFKTK